MSECGIFLLFINQSLWIFPNPSYSLWICKYRSVSFWIFYFSWYLWNLIESIQTLLNLCGERFGKIYGNYSSESFRIFLYHSWYFRDILNLYESFRNSLIPTDFDIFSEYVEIFPNRYGSFWILDLSEYFCIFLNFRIFLKLSESLNNLLKLSESIKLFPNHSESFKKYFLFPKLF